MRLVSLTEVNSDSMAWVVALRNRRGGRDGRDRDLRLDEHGHR